MAAKIKVLLVEDDKKYADSLEKIFAREGFECHWTDKPQAALSLIKLHNFDVALIDCMLPQMNGVDLAAKIRQENPVPIQLFLMSGIYKDKNFSLNAIKKTEAKSFFTKPFDISILINIINESFVIKKQESAQDIATTVKSLLSIENVTQNAVLSVIKGQSEIHGFEAPFLIHLLLSYKYRGCLSIKQKTHGINLYLSDGNLSLESHVAAPVELRALLIKEKAIAESDLSAIAEKDFTERYLASHNYVSPHFLKKVSQSLSLNKLVTILNSSKVSLALSTDVAPSNSIKLSVNEVEDMFYTCTMNSDFTSLKNYYADYFLFAFKKLNTHQNKTLQLPAIAAHKNMISHLLDGKNLESILSSGLGQEATIYKVIHILLSNREFILNTKTKQNTKAHLEKLKSLQVSMEKQNFFVRLGINERANDAEVKKAFQTLSQNFHPDKLQSESEEIKVNSRVIYELIQEAYRSLKTIEARETYLKNLSLVKEQNAAAIDSQLDQIINYLVKSDFVNAEKMFSEIEKLDVQSNKFKMIQIWLYIKNKKQPMLTINRILQSLSSDQRETDLNYFIRGLVHAANKENDKALVAFKNCLNKNSDFLPARREMATLLPSEKKDKSIFKADLKDVVGLFFKKRF